ncbi:glycosyltransferase family 4 protein [Candidatus Woesebacteria bacterium]|nr:glycosyltransferase family 4 protein [Candidatus Woesebacteria bacterium]
MRIAIDSQPLESEHSVRGIGVQISELISELKKLENKDFCLDVVDFNVIDLSKYDVVHYPYFHPFFLTLPPKKPAKKVLVTIDDLIPLIYPKYYPFGLRGRIRFEFQKKRLKYVDGILTISETSKKDICRFLGVKPDKIRVVHLAPKAIFKKLMEIELIKTKKKYNLPNEFVLYVGDVNYNKNILGLITACKIAQKTLVIVGKHAKEIESSLDNDYLTGPMDWIRYLRGEIHPEIAHYKRLAKEFRSNSNIIRLGYVQDDELVKIYNLASVYCQPSFYEGFGLPVVEAFACGTPVVAAKTQALVEIAKGAALFADPENSNDISEKIIKGVEDKKTRQLLIGEGYKVSKNYSWEKTAKEVLKTYKDLTI